MINQRNEGGVEINVVSKSDNEAVLQHDQGKRTPKDRTGALKEGQNIDGSAPLRC